MTMHRPARRTLAFLAVTLLGLGIVGGATARSSAQSPPRTFVYVVPALPTTLGVWPSEGDATQVLYAALDSGLVNYDVGKLRRDGCGQAPATTDLIGNLAASWTVVRNKHVTFRLKNVRSAWGNTLTAEDVRWSVNRALNQKTSQTIPNSLGQSAAFNMNRLMTVVNPRTIRFNLSRSTSLDVQSFANVLIPIWDSKEAKKHATSSDPWAEEWFKRNTADFGPWKLASFTPSQEIVLTPNPNWRGTRGNINRLILRAVPDATVRAQLVRSGDAQSASRLLPDQYASLESARGVNVLKCVSLLRDWLALNQKDERLKDVRVRQAISLAIDRRALVNVAYRGTLGRPARFGISQFAKFPQPPASQQFRTNVEEAKRLLAAAGYRNGFEMTLTYSNSRPGPQATPAAILIKTMLSTVGIDVNLRSIAGNTEFFTLQRGGNYQALFYNENSPIADPVFQHLVNTYTGGTANTYGFSDKAWDNLVDKARLSVPGSRQQGQLFRQLSIMAVQKMPIVYLVDNIALVAFTSSVSGYHHYPLGQLVPHQLTLR